LKLKIFRSRPAPILNPRLRVKLEYPEERAAR
jgi:hypothetical protein